MSKPQFKKRGYKEKPDGDAFHAKLKKESDVFAKLKEKLNGISPTLVDESNPDAKELKALFQQMEELKKRQMANKEMRQIQIDVLQKSQEKTKSRAEHIKMEKSKLKINNIEDADNRIRKLDAEIGSGKLRLVEEKRALQEISQLNQQKRTLQNLLNGTDSSNDLTSVQARLDMLKADQTLLSTQHDTIQAKITELKGVQNDRYADRQNTKQTKDEIRKEMTECRARMDAMRAKYNAEKDEFTRYLENQRARQEKEREGEKQEALLAKRQQRLEEAEEEAKRPAYFFELSEIETLLRMLEGKSSPDEVATAVTGIANQKQAREVKPTEDGKFQALKTKGEDEEENMFAAVSKKKKSKSKAPTDASNGPMRLQLETIHLLNKYGAPLPTSTGDVSEAVKALQKSREWYLSHREEESGRLKAKYDKLKKVIDSEPPAESGWDALSTDEVIAAVDADTSTPLKSDAEDEKAVNGETA